MSSANQHKNAFLEEAYELLTELEVALLEIEESPDNSEIIGQIFRALHTIKGSGAMFGFDEISCFTHEVESVFDLVRNGEMSVTKDLIDLTLSARDHIKNMLDNPENGAEYQQQAEHIVESLNKLSPLAGDGDVHTSCHEAVSQNDDLQPEDQERKITYRIRLRPSPDIFARPSRF